MALTRYKKKRSFSKTPEPAGGKASGKKLVFVVQKHAASRLHYDFRLELHGSLLSWAIPKGPSLNPADKRLARQVEDHPYDYKDFEGVIPEGNYGAGTVIVWDQGTYEPLQHAPTKTAKEKILTEEYEAGNMRFVLNGSKLKGEFVLIRMKGRGDHSWLLIKHRDAFASNEDITEQDESVVSGKTIDELSERKTERQSKKRTQPVARQVKRKVLSKVKSSGTKATQETFPEAETRVQTIGGRTLKFTHLNKVYWPEEGYSKRDMLNYYHQVAPYILPYMKGRPQTLSRFPDGIYGESFFQKDVTDKVPRWITTFPYFSEGDPEEKRFLVCTDEASLLYMASLGCIEMHPWSSRTSSPDHPDWCVIDLDPGQNTTFNQVIEAARVTKEILDTLELPGYCKTSGATGLHIYIPLGARYTYEESREFAQALVKIVHLRLPRFTSLERKVSGRRGKLYLDFLQNRTQATLAGPYSLRARPGAPVSIPLHWEEVKKGLSIRDFNIKTTIPRLKETGDLFLGVLGTGVDVANARKALQSVTG